MRDYNVAYMQALAAAPDPPFLPPFPSIFPDYSHSAVANAPVARSFTVVPGTLVPGFGASYDDATAINAAIGLAYPGGVVTLIPGVIYNTFSPVLPQGGVSVVSAGLTGVSSKGSGSDKGSAIIQPQASFSGSALAYPAAVAFVGSGDGGVANSNQGGLSGVWLDMSLAPSGADGISIYGQYGAGTLRGVMVVGGPGNGINMQYGTTSGKAPDGWTFDHVLVQGAGGVGVIENCSDLFAVNVHAQNCTSDCWQIQTCYHSQHIGCRGDVSATGSGVHWDTTIGTNPLDSHLWLGGGTQLNAAYGHNIVNSRATTKSCPIILGPQTLDGDTSGGIHVAGPNCVTVTGVNVNISSSKPPYALVTDFGSDGVSPPDQIMGGGGGMWSGSTAPVQDNAGMIAAGTLTIGPEVSAGTGSGLTSFKQRAGTTSLTAGSATVNSTWVTASSRVYLSRLLAGGTTGQLSVTRTAGSFTITSTSATETSTVAWALI